MKNEGRRRFSTWESVPFQRTFLPEAREVPPCPYIHAIWVHLCYRGEKFDFAAAVCVVKGQVWVLSPVIRIRESDARNFPTGGI